MGIPAVMFEPVQSPFPSARDDPDAWHRIVGLYSRTKLTFSEDKLVALSGIARNFQETTQNTYFAGMWKSDLIRQLCWINHSYLPTRNRALDSTRPTAYQAPSWSWASNNQPTTWNHYCGDIIFDKKAGQVDLIEVTDMVAVPLGGDTLGQLKDAKLKVKSGPLISGTALNALLDYYSCSHRSNDKSYQIHLDKSDNSKTFFLRNRGEIHYDDGKERSDLKDGVYFLPLLEESKSGDGPESLYSDWSSAVGLYGLVVIQAEGRGKGHFARLGAWNLIFNVESHKELVALLQHNSKGLMNESLCGETMGFDKNGTPLYALTLV